MALHLAIDGYNLLGASTGRGLGVRDIEKERENLIERLNAYRRVKGCKVTVVFDARGSGRLTRTRGKRNGIEVIFSGADEDADLKRGFSYDSHLGPGGAGPCGVTGHRCNHLRRLFKTPGHGTQYGYKGFGRGPDRVRFYRYGLQACRNRTWQGCQEKGAFETGP
jgi:hypothetical protein